MATRYSDLIQLRDSKPAYNIQHEEHGEWSTFIANDQFNDVLKKVIGSVRGDGASVHSSFWLEGTYGSGKSHAAAVITHLLSDPIEEIEEWIDEEYKAGQHELLRSGIYELRKQKRLFPVKLNGASNIAQKKDLSLVIQKAVKEALKDAGIDILVKTDYDSYKDNVTANPKIWDTIIAENSLLRGVAPDRNKLIADMESQDAGTLKLMIRATRDLNLDVTIGDTNLKDWLFDIQDKLREIEAYRGLFIVWDEFTEVVRSGLGQSLLTDLQGIVEAGYGADKDVYLFLITHPSALEALNPKERMKTTDRYVKMDYDMETVSAFKIMSRKFKHVCSEAEILDISAGFYNNTMKLLESYSQVSEKVEETREDIRNLFPLHPATAYLSTYYARQAGSSSRSVFEFIGANPAIRDFLDDEQHFHHKDTITADYLWDYVYEELKRDNNKFGAVVQRYNLYVDVVKQMGTNYSAVFKGVLLLNAFNNLSRNRDLNLNPTQENIAKLFLSTPLEPSVEEVLAWLDNQRIIPRDPSGIYSILFSSLPADEIENERNKLKKSDFCFTHQIINYGESAAHTFKGLLYNVVRPHVIAFYSDEPTEHLFIDKIKKASDKCAGYELSIAVVVARNAQELAKLKDIISRATSADDSLKNTIFLVQESLLGDDNYGRFIEYMANANCAAKRHITSQAKTYTDQAVKILENWLGQMKTGNIYMSCGGGSQIVYARNISGLINMSVAPKIYNKGIDALEIARGKSSTFWDKKKTQKVVSIMLSYDTKDDILEHLEGQAALVKCLLQDSVDENLDWKTGIDPNHPLKIACDFVDKKIAGADKTNDFNMADKFKELTRPPYGFYMTYWCMATLAFAMRKYADKVFGVDGRPHSAKHLVDDVVETFKCWDANVSNCSKVTLKFETPEEGKLWKSLVEVFNLNGSSEYGNITSLKNARWAINNKFIKDKGFPLWSLKYVGDIGYHPDGHEAHAREGLNTAIENILKICKDETTIKNPSLMASTIDLIGRWKLELRALIGNADNYSTGFANYLKSNEIVNLQDEEMEEAIDYIRRDAEGDVWPWSEEQVMDSLKNWRMEKDRQSRKPNDNPQPPEKDDEPTWPSSSQRKERARERLAMMDRDELASALEGLIDQGNEAVISALIGND